MGKIAFLFSGQGSQYVGMGKDFYDNFSISKNLFEEAKNIRSDIVNICFNGSDEEINNTVNSQMCLYLMEYSIYKILEEKNVKPNCVAGFSLGELTAFCVANGFNFFDGLKIIDVRSKLMSEEAEKIDTCMLAVLKLSDRDVISICKEYKDTYPVNFNCDGQVVVSTKTENVKSLENRIKECKGRALPLKVSGGFHCDFMNEASKQIKGYIENITFKNLSIPLYSNITGKVFEGSILENISKHIKSPVLFKDSIKNMINDGVDTFIEIGPSKTLSGFVKKTDKNVNVYNICDIDSLNETLASIGVNK